MILLWFYWSGVDSCTLCAITQWKEAMNVQNCYIVPWGTCSCTVLASSFLVIPESLHQRNNSGSSLWVASELLYRWFDTRSYFTLRSADSLKLTMYPPCGFTSSPYLYGCLKIYQDSSQDCRCTFSLPGICRTLLIRPTWQSKGEKDIHEYWLRPNKAGE